MLINWDGILRASAFIPPYLGFSLSKKCISWVWLHYFGVRALGSECYPSNSAPATLLNIELASDSLWMWSWQLLKLQTFLTQG